MEFGWTKKVSGMRDREYFTFDDFDGRGPQFVCYPSRAEAERAAARESANTEYRVVEGRWTWTLWRPAAQAAEGG